MVTLQIRVVINSVGTGGQIEIESFPYTSTNGVTQVAGTATHLDSGTRLPIQGIMNGATTGASFYKLDGGNFADTNIATGDEILFSITYQK